MASPPQQPAPFHIIDIYRTLKKASPQGEPVLWEGDKKLEVFQDYRKQNCSGKETNADAREQAG